MIALLVLALTLAQALQAPPCTCPDSKLLVSHGSPARPHAFCQSYAYPKGDPKYVSSMCSGGRVLVCVANPQSLKQADRIACGRGSSGHRAHGLATLAPKDLGCPKGMGLAVCVLKEFLQGLPAAASSGALNTKIVALSSSHVPLLAAATIMASPSVSEAPPMLVSTSIMCVTINITTTEMIPVTLISTVEPEASTVTLIESRIVENPAVTVTARETLMHTATYTFTSYVAESLVAEGGEEQEPISSMIQEEMPVKGQDQQDQQYDRVDSGDESVADNVDYRDDDNGDDDPGFAKGDTVDDEPKEGRQEHSRPV